MLVLRSKDWHIDKIDVYSVCACLTFLAPHADTDFQFKSRAPLLGCVDQVGADFALFCRQMNGYGLENREAG